MSWTMLGKTPKALQSREEAGVNAISTRKLSLQAFGGLNGRKGTLDVLRI